MLPIYLLTNSDGRPQSRDTLASAIPAWRLATHGDLDVTDFKDPWLIAYDARGINRQNWYVESGGRVTSNRPPGAIFWAVPFYWLAGANPEQMTLGPATVAASVAVAMGVIILTAVFQKLIGTRGGLAAGLVAGLATPLWGIASDALWQHSVTVIWLGLGVLFMSNAVYGRAGLAGGLALFTRPLTGVMSAVWGTYLAAKERSWRPMIVIGLSSAVGLGLLFWYYDKAFATSELTGGYGSYPTEALTGRSLSSYLENIWAMLFSADRGVFLYSPFLLILMPGLRAGWKAAPDWVKAGALSGLIYMLVQLRINSYTGGQIAWSYRLPLDMLVVVSPLLVLAYREWVAKSKLILGVFWLAVGASILVQVVTAAQLVS